MTHSTADIIQTEAGFFIRDERPRPYNVLAPVLWLYRQTRRATKHNQRPGGPIMAFQGQLAIRSKLPGDQHDYRVLWQSGGPLVHGEVEQAYFQLNVGTMPLEAKSPAEREPWLTFGAYPTAAGRSLVALRQEWTGHGDSRGRPAVAQPLLALPYDPLAALQPGFATLAGIIPPYERFLPDGSGELEPLELRLEGAEARLTEIAHLIDSPYEFYAAVAALMLQSPVALVGCEE